MKITRDNYESFFLDYLEGNLEETMIDQFLDFLKQNPDLKEELQLFENIPLPQEQVAFTGKQLLYRSTATDSFDRKAVAYMEGDLKEKDRQAFKATLLSNPKLQAEYALFEKTRLTTDTGIRFPQKEKLYKKSATLLWINYMGKAAAILILLWGISMLFKTGEDTRIPTDSKQVASVKAPELKVPFDSQPRVTEPRVNEPLEQNIHPVAKPRAIAKKSTHLASNAQGLKKLTSTPQSFGTENNQRESLAIDQLASIPAHFNKEPVEIALVPLNRLKNQRINNQPAVMTLDEYLALKAKKATNEGILSANRLLRVGLNVASELSGERLGYTVRNGKVASLDFESKLLAFEIPLEKK